MPNISERYSHFFYESNPHKIANSRSTPAIVLLNYELNAVYHNQEAVHLINENLSSGDNSKETKDALDLPHRLIEFCNKLKTSSDNTEPMTEIPPLIIENPTTNHTYLCFRVFPISSLSTRKIERRAPYFIVMIEKIVSPTSWITSFKLSKREARVLELLFMGYSNKEIAEKLYISTYTAEDHIKNLMKKFKVKNRLSIITKFLEFHP